MLAQDDACCKRKGHYTERTPPHLALEIPGGCGRDRRPAYQPVGAIGCEIHAVKGLLDGLAGLFDISQRGATVTLHR